LSSKPPKSEKVEFTRIGVFVGGYLEYPFWTRWGAETILDGKNGYFWRGLRGAIHGVAHQFIQSGDRDIG
jgi:hypothetical protein